MAGRRIRWTGVGRATAIGLAVVAAVAALPALLGSGAPPPVPDDVGVAPPSPPIAGSVDVAAEPLHPESPPLVKRPARGEEKRKRDKPPRRQRRHDRDQAETTVAAVPTYVPAPLYVPSSSGEFQIERP